MTPTKMRMPEFALCVVFILTVLLMLSVMMAAGAGDQIDYSSWEADFPTLVSHLRMSYVSFITQPKVLSPEYLAWREKHLANASPEIKAEALSALERSVHSGKGGNFQASSIEYLGAMGNLDPDEVSKVTALVVDVSRIDQDLGKESERAGAFLETFLPRQQVPHREEIAIRALKSGNVYIRSAAASALGLIGTEKGLEALKNYLLTHATDADSDVSLRYIRYFAKVLEERLGAAVVNAKTSEPVTVPKQSSTTGPRNTPNLTGEASWRGNILYILLIGAVVGALYAWRVYRKR